MDSEKTLAQLRQFLLIISAGIFVMTVIGTFLSGTLELHDPVPSLCLVYAWD